MRSRIITLFLIASTALCILTGCQEIALQSALSPALSPTASAVPTPTPTPTPTASPTPTPTPTPTPVYPGVELAEFATGFVGCKYRWGGISPETGFDCSGFVYYVYGEFGYTINRIASDQAANGVHVEPDELLPGDVLCFYSGKHISHSGIYIGDGKFVHAQSSDTGVVITELADFYVNRGLEARRIIELGDI